EWAFRQSRSHRLAGGFSSAAGAAGTRNARASAAAAGAVGAATAAATSAAVAATTTTTVATAAATATARAARSSPGTSLLVRLVDDECAAFQGMTVQGCDGSTRSFRGSHAHESEPSRPAGFAV